MVMQHSPINFETLSRAAKFRHFCRLLCDTLGVGLVFVDPAARRRDLLGYRAEQAPLCTFMRRRDAFAGRCAECDRDHLVRAAGASAGQFYLCHAGLVDWVVPVHVGGRHVGTFMGGQVLPKAPTAVRFRRFARGVAAYGFEEKSLRRLYFATPAMEEGRLRNLVELIGLFAAHLDELGERLLEPEWPGDSPVKRALAYIQGHLAEPFGLVEVARAAGVTPTYLSGLFCRDQGESLVVFLRRRRVELAQKLLAETGHSLERVATASGFGSQRSFHRAFRLVAGCGPAAWRTGHRQGSRRQGLPR